MKCQAPHCRKELPVGSYPHRRRYCSHRCRQTAYRDRVHRRRVEAERKEAARWKTCPGCRGRGEVLRKGQR